jgi:hypothetical protein
MRLILKRLIQAGLKLKPRNCELCMQNVVNLGFAIDGNGVKPAPSNLDLIQRRQRPDNMKALRGFAGSVSRYFSFYPQLAFVPAPLARVTGRRILTWSDELEEAFNLLNLLSRTLTRSVYLLHTISSSWKRMLPDMVLARCYSNHKEGRKG